MSKREWWIFQLHPPWSAWRVRNVTSRSAGSDIHVVELTPGAIQITREQLREAWNDLYDPRTECGHCSLKELERELFGEEAKP